MYMCTGVYVREKDDGYGGKTRDGKEKLCTYREGKKKKKYNFAFKDIHVYYIYGAVEESGEFCRNICTSFPCINVQGDFFSAWKNHQMAEYKQIHNSNPIIKNNSMNAKILFFFINFAYYL